MATILVVDDDHELLKTMEKILESHGHTVATASDGERALAEFAGLSPDLVISDIYMPNMDGIEFLIRTQSLFPEASILTMSGGGYKPKEDVLDMARRLGAVGTLEKPFGVSEVLERVAEALGEEAAGGGE